MATTIEKLETLFQKQIKNKQIFGMVLAIQTGDNLLDWSAAAGTATPEKNEPIGVDSPYFIASVTKIFTASAIMLLHEQQKLDLDTPIARFFPTDQLDGLHHFRGQSIRVN